MSDPSHHGFLGDGDHTFLLTPDMILELERTTGAGIGRLFRRITERDFKHVDLSETIRCALIGGGMAPHDAHALVGTYVIPRPFLEVYPLAISILEALFYGASKPVAQLNEDTDGQA